jgi:hypothetical protein
MPLGEEVVVTHVRGPIGGSVGDKVKKRVYPRHRPLVSGLSRTMTDTERTSPPTIHRLEHPNGHMQTRRLVVVDDLGAECAFSLGRNVNAAACGASTALGVVPASADTIGRRGRF